MPPQQKLISYLGLSKQTAKGAGATSPATFGFGVTSGKVFDVPLTQDYEDQTLAGGASDRFSPAVNRTEANPAVVFQTRAWKASVGAFLLGVLGADSVAGTGPYTHTITPAQTLPYWTIFAKYGAGGENEKLVDCIIDEVTIGWDERKPLTVDASILGITPTTHTTTFTATNDDTVQPYFLPVGGTLTLDTGSNTPAAAQVKGFSCKISNSSVPIPLSKAILPDDIFPAEQMVEGTVTLVPNDFGDWLKIITGTATGTAVQSAPQYGSLSMLVQIDANSQLTLATSYCAFTAPFPDSDPKGGPMELDLAFSTLRPTGGGAAFTGTVKNGTATY